MSTSSSTARSTITKSCVRSAKRGAIASARAATPKSSCTATRSGGVGLFPRLDGMFALAIVDECSGDVVLARDRLGIKPLVRTTGDRLAFASDAIALVQAGLSSGEVDLAALRGFAVFHYVPPPATELRMTSAHRSSKGVRQQLPVLWIRIRR